MRALAILLLAASASAFAQSPAPYAGQESRAIKALSEDELKSYLAGAGMGYAKAAELNHYPGPMHTLELAETLGLSPDQRAAMESLVTRHKAEARDLGAEVVRLERELDALFAHAKATPGLVDAKLAEIGAAQARYRGSHLKTHIEATKLLTPDQVARYDALRGYTGAAPAGRSGGHGQGREH
jgi:Spy/CpxP family protein refolding chaperone